MFWDRVAWVYDVFANGINRRANRAMCAAVAAHIGPEDEVLECACGTGLLTGVIAARCRALTATDFSEKMLAQAERKYANCRNVRFAQADITKLDYPDGRFDAVVAANVIHLLDEPLQALRELDRVCRPGGRLIIPTYMNRTDKGTTNRVSGAIGRAGADFKREFTLESYQAFFAAAGYTDALRRAHPLRGGGPAKAEGGDGMKVTTLDEASIRDIGQAFGYYDYGEEHGLIDAFPSRDAAAAFICGYVRMALQGGMLHTTSPRGEGYLAYKRPGQKLSLRAMLPLAKGFLGAMALPSLIRFTRIMAQGGPGLDKRLDREKKPYIFVGLVCVRQAYQGQGYMRKVMEMAFAEGDWLGIPVILETDARSKCDKYLHLGMKLAGTRRFGTHGLLYDLIRYPETK